MLETGALYGSGLDLLGLDTARLWSRASRGRSMRCSPWKRR